MYYIVRNKLTKVIVRTSRTPIAVDDRGDPIIPSTLNKDLEILEVIQADRPTEITEGKKLVSTETELNGQILKDYEEVDLTVEDLAEIAAQEASATELEQIKAVYQDLKGGVGTAGERLTRVERVLARLLRDNYN